MLNSVLLLQNIAGTLLCRKSIKGVALPMDKPLEFFDLKLFLNEELFILINKMVGYLDMP